MEVGERQQGLGVDGLQVPAEGLALELPPQRRPPANVAAVNLPRQRVDAIREVLSFSQAVRNFVAMSANLK